MNVTSQSDGRQVLGSTMHCVAGDGIGILVGAVVGPLLRMPPIADVALEYVLGFAFGWTIFQALFMRDMAGGSYKRSLASTFIPELLSMNLLMTGMVPVMSLAMKNVAGSHDPSTSTFWFRMSMALLSGFVVAYPMNWWLVSHHLKHGMMTVRASGAASMAVNGGEAHAKSTGMHKVQKVSTRTIALMSILSFVAFGVGLLVSWLLGGL